MICGFCLPMRIHYTEKQSTFPKSITVPEIFSLHLNDLERIRLSCWWCYWSPVVTVIYVGKLLFIFLNEAEILGGKNHHRSWICGWFVSPWIQWIQLSIEAVGNYFYSPFWLPIALLYMITFLNLQKCFLCWIMQEPTSDGSLEASV